MLSINNLGNAISTTACADKSAIIEICPQSGVERSVSYGALRQSVDRMCASLSTLNHPLGSRIALAGDNSVDYLAAYFAIMRLNLVATPINVKNPRALNKQLYDRTGIALTLTDEIHDDAIPSAAASRTFQSLLNGVSAPSVQRPAGDGAAEILFTSGSTGLPKGVILSHAGQIWVLSQLLRDTPADSVFLVAAPLFHMNGLILSTLCLAAGATLVLLTRFDAAAYLAAVDHHACTNLTGVPTMFALLARQDTELRNLKGTSVRQIFMGSAPLTPSLCDTVQQFFPQSVICNGYGTTEIGAAVFGPHPDGLERPKLALGHPYQEVEVTLDGGGDTGELLVRTPAVMQGYDQSPQESAARFHAGWYKTGDIMRRDRDGFFYFVGRADDMFTCGGENIYPTEVEKLLEAHPMVRQACVIPAVDEVKGHVPVAFIVPREGAALTAEDVRTHALKNAPAYQHPRAVVFLDALPLSGAKKVDRARLLASAAEAFADHRKQKR